MKKFKERMAERAGFTLVELIVVIAILGILAAVAVPAYSGYIKKANEASDYTQLDAIKTATVFVAVEDNIPNDTTVSKITVTFATEGSSGTAGSVKYDATVGGESKTNVSADISDYSTIPASKSGATTAVWTAADEKWELDPVTGGEGGATGGETP